MDFLEDDLHPHLYELIQIFANAAHKELHQFLRMPVEKIKENYSGYPSSFLHAGIKSLADLEEYSYCQAFQEMLDERRKNEHLKKMTSPKH